MNVRQQYFDGMTCTGDGATTEWELYVPERCRVVSDSVLLLERVGGSRDGSGAFWSYAWMKYDNLDRVQGNTFRTRTPPPNGFIFGVVYLWEPIEENVTP